MISSIRKAIYKILALWLLAGFCLPTIAGTYTNLTAVERDDLINRAKASLFLSRTTFGPTMAQINNLAASISTLGEVPAYDAWIDAQFALPQTLVEKVSKDMILTDGQCIVEATPDCTGNNSSAYVWKVQHNAWWHIAMTANDQLRQRVGWALYQLFIINSRIIGQRSVDLSGEAGWVGVTDYLDKLSQHADGNYRDLLRDVSMHPVMGTYLSHLRNRKGDGVQFPDENFAREVLQLFSIGLYELNIDGSRKSDNGNPIETYNNETIKAFARVFTGLGPARDTFGNYFRNYNEPMQMFNYYHDGDQKELLNGATLPANQPGLQDINDALDNIFEHNNIGPFFGKHLIQRLVMSNPSKAYIQRVAQAFNGSGANPNRGNLKAVIKAILLDPDALAAQQYVTTETPPSSGFYDLSINSKGVEFMRLREPVLRQTALMRAFKPSSNFIDPTYFPEGQFPLNFGRVPYQQIPQQAPRVFNYYFPDYQPPGPLAEFDFSSLTDGGGAPRLPGSQLYAPEFEITNSVTSIELNNVFLALIRERKKYMGEVIPSEGNASVIVDFDFSEEDALKSDLSVLINHLDLLLCNASLSDAAKSIINTAISSNSSETFSWRVSLATQGVALSPECAIQ